MINWIKNINGKWDKSTNDISTIDIAENLKPTSELNIPSNEKSIIYIPTHNINDVYEWYRLFNDSYAFSENFDKFGFGIHAWFDKSRGQSIKGWFPNLVEVKCSSTNKIKYYDDGVSYFRSSIDYIENFTNLDQLIIDNVIINNNEKVLLKNQSYDELTLFTIDTLLSFNNIFYIIINPGDEQYFSIGNNIILKNIDNTFILDKILLINYTNINGTDYAVIKTVNEHANAIELADTISGNWIENSFKENNGIYEFVNGNLTLIDLMFDKYKTYSQIVYTYQGETNINKEFYLRRNEEKFHINYSLFPYSGIGEELIYSEGSAYLIKCELDYDLSIDSSSNINVATLSSCCECIANLNVTNVQHPTTNPPYDDLETDPFRLLVLDPTVAEKIMSTTTNGIGDYKLTGHVGDIDYINLGNPTQELEFALYDIDGYDNFLNQYVIDKYPGLGFNLNLNFNYKNLTPTEALSVTFTENNNIDITNVVIVPYDNGVATPFLIGETIDFVNGASGIVKWLLDLGPVGLLIVELTTENILLSDNLAFTGLTSGASALTDVNHPFPGITAFQEFTYLILTYDGMNHFPITALSAGDFVDVKFDVTINNVVTNLVDYQFVSSTTVKTSTDLEMAIYPAFDKNMLNDIKRNLELGNDIGNSLELTLKLVNTYGSESGNTKDNIESLMDCINRTIIGKTYDFTYEIDLTNEVYLYFNGLRRNTKYKWYNMGVQFIYDSDFYNIEHKIEWKYRPYFYHYNATKYNFFNFFNEYLGIGPYNLNQLIQFNLNYNNIAGNSDRFGIEGSIKKPDYGNIIYFGADYKELILDNVKRQSFINVSMPSIAYSDDEIWVDSIEWDEINNLGIITLLSYVRIPNNGTNVIITPLVSIEDIASKLEDVFDKKINSISEETYGFNTSIEYNVYKPDTSTYAHMLLQSGTDLAANKTMLIYNSISAILFKDYNEPRITFTKRDRNFLFDNDAHIFVKCASENDVDILSAPVSIDGYVLVATDLIVLKDQNDPTENGIYEFVSVGNPLVRYDDFNLTNYWNVKYGITNINKTFQAYYELPLEYGTTDIIFVEKQYRRKSDPRLTIRPIEIAKLGVDNETQPWKKINIKYDTQEEVENLLTIQPGINSIYEIRFIDGLTEYNILNDINGQGQYAWILRENVLTENAVVGCTQTNGPGTGEIIWYTGTWVQGTWCNGIWIQGTWIDGTWVNGTHNAYPIQDYYYYVNYTPTTNNTLSLWINGTWLNGIWNGGIAENINWVNGTFNFGIIKDGLWTDGIFYNGIINHIIWETGTFYGGDFETGIWKSGTLSEIDPTIPARFGTGADASSTSYSDRAIWIKGTFDSGQFHSGDNTLHNGSIFYAGTIIDADWYGGSFISGSFQNSIWYDGVWFGGYYVSNMTNGSGSYKNVTLQPFQYDEILGLTVLGDYIQHETHNLNTFDNSFILFGTPVAPSNFSNIAFLNEFDMVYNTTYIKKPIVPGSVTDTTLILDISAEPIISGYVVADTVFNTPDGRPFICSEFTGIWKSGIFLNGYFKSGTWETGTFINGYFANGVFGINQE